MDDHDPDQLIVPSAESQLDIIPIVNIAPDDAIIETYVIQEDGSLLPILDQIEDEPKKLTRKRKRNCKNWKRNVAKVNRQSGNVYKNSRGVLQPSRRVKIKGCSNPLRCPYQCMTKISQSARQTIFDSFWALDDSEKRHFYVANVKRSRCVRKRTEAASSQKSHNFNFRFNYLDEDIQVCQQFFNNTLNISYGRVYYYFSQNKHKATVTPGVLRHGKHTKKVLSIQQKQEIRDHINKFPVVDSHYCRQNTNKNYLDQGLNLSIMYRLYKEETASPAKLSAYRDIFNYEFNLSFFHPKKDRCDKCMAFEILTSLTKEVENDHQLHVVRKQNAAVERKKDRDILPIVHKQKKSAIVAVDMQNVFQLPITNASIAYYSRKFAVLSFTAVIDKVVYNVMWNEALCGREGTHIANALIKVLTRITQNNPVLETITVWSDSCVPQNRNSIMSAAIQRFLDSSISSLVQVDQKFSEPGHSQVQEVDTAHSVIERSLRRKFIYSPPALLDEIRKIPEGKLKFIVLEMETADYWDYQLLAQAKNYAVIPYTKVKQLTYKKNQSSIWLKYDFPDDLLEKPINCKPSKISEIQGPLLHLTLNSKLSADKIMDIRKMFGIMPEADRLYYQGVFTNHDFNNINLHTLNGHEHKELNDQTEENPEDLVPPCRQPSSVRKSVKPKPLKKILRNTTTMSVGITSKLPSSKQETLNNLANLSTDDESIRKSIVTQPSSSNLSGSKRENICDRQPTQPGLKDRQASPLNESMANGQFVDKRTSKRIRKPPAFLESFDY